MENIMVIVRSSIGAFAIGAVLGFVLAGGIFIPLLTGYVLALVMYRKKNQQEVLFIRQAAIQGFVMGFALNLFFPMLFGAGMGSPMYSAYMGLIWAAIFGFLIGNGVRTRGL